VSKHDRSEGEPCETHPLGAFDLSELLAVYGENSLRTLLAVALAEFDGQHVAFERALERRQWARAAEAVHRLNGTAAFFSSDAQSLAPLGLAERALRLADVSLVERTVPNARATLAALGAAFVVELAKRREGRQSDGLQ
jgi:hypothetical protein